jgi:NAD(P)-dependent dehydrogenase (short-subunit alcohol dehydrogenase family)
MIDLTGRIVVVTGAAGHLGRAVVAKAAAAGARLALLDRSPDRLDPVAAEAENVIRLSGLDLTDSREVEQALGAVTDRFGRLDGVVCTVGAFHASAGLGADDWSVWETMLTANLRATLVACQAALPRLTSPGGRIIAVGARPALVAPAGMAAYAAAKSGVLRLIESLAAEQAERGITANTVLPSIIDTSDNRKAMPKADPSRWVTPDAIADVILFLLSDMPRAISGAAIPVYGRS